MLCQPTATALPMPPHANPMIARALFLLGDVKADCEMDQGVHALLALRMAIALLLRYVEEEGLGMNVSDLILDLSARACR